MKPTAASRKITPDFSRPPDGWLRASRLARGLSLRAVAERLVVSPQAVHQFEKSEVAGTISLRQLENVARAMGYRVVYALQSSEARRPATTVPDHAPATPEATSPLPSAPEMPPAVVEHSMLLENQAADRYD